MNILLATPCQGTLSSKWFNSYLRTQAAVTNVGHTLAVIVMDRDNFIARARNFCAVFAMEKNFDKLLFIDADQVWTPEQVLLLLRSTNPIVGGTYPYKELPLKLVFNPLPEHELPNRSPPSFLAYAKKYANEKGEIEVLHLPTGFLLIDVQVFKTLLPHTKKYSWVDPQTKEKRIVPDFFRFGLVKPEGEEIYFYETEDWGFCTFARSCGFKIHLQMGAVIDHIGQYQYSIYGGLK